MSALMCLYICLYDCDHEFYKVLHIKGSNLFWSY